MGIMCKIYLFIFICWGNLSGVEVWALINKGETGGRGEIFQRISR